MQCETCSNEADQTIDVIAGSKHFDKSETKPIYEIDTYHVSLCEKCLAEMKQKAYRSKILALPFSFFVLELICFAIGSWLLSAARAADPPVEFVKTPLFASLWNHWAIYFIGILLIFCIIVLMTKPNDYEAAAYRLKTNGYHTNDKIFTIAEVTRLERNGQIYHRPVRNAVDRVLWRDSDSG